MPGSLVSTRSRRVPRRRRAVGDDDHARRAASSRCRRRRRGGSSPSVAPAAVLTSALRIGPVGDGVGAVLHRLGLAVRRRDRAAVEVIAADHDRRLHLARAHQLVEREAHLRAVAVAEPADARRQPLELRRAPARARSSARDPRRSGPRRARPRSVDARCPPDRPRARPSGTGPCPRRTAGGCTRARSPGMSNARSQPASLRARRGCCCRSRRPRRRVFCIASIASTSSAMLALRASRCSPRDPPRAARPPPRARSPCGM